MVVGYPEIVLALRLHKFPEGTSIIIVKALLDNRIYVLPPGTLLLFCSGPLELL